MSGVGDTQVTLLVPSVSVFHVFHVFHVFTGRVRGCLGLVTPGVTPLPSVRVFPVFHVFHVFNVFHVFTRGVRVCLGLVTPGVTPLPSVSVLPVRAASPSQGHGRPLSLSEAVTSAWVSGHQPTFCPSHCEHMTETINQRQ